MPSPLTVGSGTLIGPSGRSASKRRTRRSRIRDLRQPHAAPRCGIPRSSGRGTGGGQAGSKRRASKSRARGAPCHTAGGPGGRRRGTDRTEPSSRASRALAAAAQTRQARIQRVERPREWPSLRPRRCPPPVRPAPRSPSSADDRTPPRRRGQQLLVPREPRACSGASPAASAWIAKASRWPAMRSSSSMAVRSVAARGGAVTSQAASVARAKARECATVASPASRAAIPGRGARRLAAHQHQRAFVRVAEPGLRPQH